jgi:hypothetical protein
MQTGEIMQGPFQIGKRWCNPHPAASKNTLPFFAFFLVLSTLAGLSWGKTIFRDDYTVYNNSTISLVFMEQMSSTDTGYSYQELDPLFRLEEFCVAIQRNNETMQANCRVAGALSRHSSFMAYAHWLGANMHSKTSRELLRARDDSVATLLYSLTDQYVLLFIQNIHGNWVVLLHGEQRFPAGMWQYPKKDWKELLDNIAHDVFRDRAIRIPTKEERDLAKSQPDVYYQDRMTLDKHFGVAIAYSAGLPLGAPRSWLGGVRTNQVRDFRFSDWNSRSQADSTSAWNWMQDEVLVYSLRAGVTYGRALGVDALLRYSRHGVKYSSQDSLHNYIQEWAYNRFELGMQGRIGATFYPAPYLEIMPAGAIGFVYSFMQEDFRYDPSVALPEDARQRITFSQAYKGAHAAFVLRSLWFSTIALTFETGVTSRGSSRPLSPTAGAGNDGDENVASYQEMIGRTTIDYFTGFTLEYNFRTFLE